MSRTRPSLRRQMGSTLLPVTFVMVTVVGLSMGMMEHGLAEKTSLRHDETSAAAFELAEIGLAKAEMELRGQLDLDGNGIGVVEGSVPGGYGRDALQYEVGYARSGADPSLYTLQAVGQANLSVRRVVVDVKVADSYRFTHALLATRELKMEDDVTTTSYDSRDASLPPAEQSMARLGRAALESGHVGAGGDIELKDDVSIRGNARPGPRGQLRIARGDDDDDDDDDDDGRGGVRITGDRSPVGADREHPQPAREDFEHALRHHDNAGIRWTADVSYRRSSMRLDAHGQAIVVFPGGTYFFNELTVRDGAKVVFEGPSTVYVAGELEISSDAGFNVPGRPGDVTLIAHSYDVHESHRSPRDPILIEKHARAALTLYAPGRDVKLDDSAVVYGAIVGRDVHAKRRAEAHFDLALAAEDPSVSGLETVAWREHR